MLVAKTYASVKNIYANVKNIYASVKNIYASDKHNILEDGHNENEEAPEHAAGLAILGFLATIHLLLLHLSSSSYLIGSHRNCHLCF